MCPNNWISLSNELDRRVQMIGLMCPKTWTNLSNLSL